MNQALDDFLKKAGDSPVLVSACLLGLATRYDGDSKADADLLARAASARLIPVCPEQLGGLSTPRPKSSLSGGDGSRVLTASAKVKSESGKDVTENFLRGARAVAALAKITGARFAILKDKSPSCGVTKTNIDFQTADGPGVAAAVLKSLKIEIFVLP